MPTATRSESDRTIEMAQRSARSRGEDAVPVPSHTSMHVPEDFRSINGWGADLDPADRPMVPRELRTTQTSLRGEVRDWQEPRHRIHMSNEMPNLTPVFGDTCPPSGVSGRLRDYAYEYGEGTNRHWLTLILADRIEMAGSLLAGALRGRPDDYVREKGWTAAIAPGDGAKSRTVLIAGLALLGLATAGLLASRRSRSDW